jgi:molybdopterin-guanine dinucleotide biosynthesis protein MobB
MTPPIIAVVGRKNSGKTTLLVALAAELRRRGLRVASLKHSHHDDFEMDQPGKDSWRHFHEGGVEAVIVASPRKVAMVMRAPDADRDPEALVRRFLAGQDYDLVLVESFRHAAFPRIEVFRSEAHAEPLYDPAADGPPCIALVTDVPGRFAVPFPVLAIEAGGGHVERLAALVGVLAPGREPVTG